MKNEEKQKTVLLDADCAKHVRQVASCHLCSRYADCLKRRGEVPARPDRGNEDERLIAFTKRREYHVDRHGNAWAINRFSGARIELHPAMHNGHLRICIKGVQGMATSLARLIYAAFRGEIAPNLDIAYRDGNPENVSLDNLATIDRTLRKKTVQEKGPKAKPVVVCDHGKDIEFKSVRAAAKYLNMSYQTLMDFLNAKTGWRSSVPGLKGVQVAYLRKEDEPEKRHYYHKKKWGMPKGGWPKKGTV